MTFGMVRNFTTSLQLSQTVLFFIKCLKKNALSFELLSTPRKPIGLKPNKYMKNSNILNA